MTDTKTFEARRQALRASIRDKGLSALLVTQAANRYYLSGFELHDTQCNETAGWLLITTEGRDVLLTDPRYEEAAVHALGPDGAFIYTGKRLPAIRGFLKDAAAKGLGFEAKGMSVYEHAQLTQDLALIEADGLVEKLRLRKDTAEIEAVRASNQLNHRLFRNLSRFLEPGRTEAEVAWDIERFFRENGAQSMAFPSIVAVGRNAALPHAIPGDTAIRHDELVLVDTGCRVRDYCSDQTRTVWVGNEPSARFTEMLERVKEAQAAAVKVLRPGLPLADAYRAARAVFEGYGVADRFTHSLGHGVGLQTHEAPTLSNLATGSLEPGMVVTVEPGLYYPEWGGARWEHMALITEDGAEVL